MSHTFKTSESCQWAVMVDFDLSCLLGMSKDTCIRYACNIESGYNQVMKGRDKSQTGPTWITEFIAPQMLLYALFLNSYMYSYSNE